MRSFSFKRGDSNDAVRQHLVQQLSKQQNSAPAEQWLQAFRIGFQQPQGDAETLITFDNISRALATYQRSQLFVNTPWRAYVQGDRHALSEAAKKGRYSFLVMINSGVPTVPPATVGIFLPMNNFTPSRCHKLAGANALVRVATLILAVLR